MHMCNPRTGQREGEGEGDTSDTSCLEGSDHPGQTEAVSKREEKGVQREGVQGTAG